MLGLTQTVARRLLLLGAVVCAGCIIPTPLQQAEQTPNFRPSFVAELCDPPLETTIVKQINGGSETSPIVQPHIVAEDPNPDDMLSVRIFRATGSTLVFADEIPSLTAISQDNRVQRSGDFQPRNWCGIFAGNMTTTVPIEIVAIVADRPFFPVGMGKDDQVVQGGLSSRAGWQLVCQ